LEAAAIIPLPNSTKGPSTHGLVLDTNTSRGRSDFIDFTAGLRISSSTFASHFWVKPPKDVGLNPAEIKAVRKRTKCPQRGRELIH